MPGLTPKLAFVVDCFPNPDGEPDKDRWESAKVVLADYVVRSRRFLGKRTKKEKSLLDIGCGNAGSDFVNRVSNLLPDMKVVYLDSAQFLLDELEKPNKICADATNIPYPSNSFDCAYAGHIINGGISSNNIPIDRDASYRIAEEARRVLKPGGSFIFTYHPGRCDTETLKNLNRIGFKEVEHLLRMLWFRGIPMDTYAARK